MYGCIKPDFNNEDLKRAHILGESIESMGEYSEKFMDDSISLKDFSESLGVVCHFICDYFCLYHNDEHSRKSMFFHIIYEIVLHYRFLTLLLLSKLNTDNYKLKRQSLTDTVLELHQQYNSEDKSITKDITYALTAAVLISESIVCLSQINVKFILL